MQVYRCVRASPEVKLMWRLLGLTLVFVASATTAVNAESRIERPAARGIETALQQSAAAAGNRLRALHARDALLQLQIGGALALAQPSLRAAVADGRVSMPVNIYPMLTLRGDRPAARRLPRWLDLDSGAPGLAYPVTDTLSLGLDYRYLRSEDLVFKVAKTGSLDSDYQSHNVLLQARWDF
jgi:hypothetical protein